MGNLEDILALSRLKPIHRESDVMISIAALAQALPPASSRVDWLYQFTNNLTNTGQQVPHIPQMLFSGSTLPFLTVDRLMGTFQSLAWFSG